MAGTGPQIGGLVIDLDAPVMRAEPGGMAPAAALAVPDKVPKDKPPKAKPHVKKEPAAAALGAAGDSGGGGGSGAAVATPSYKEVADGAAPKAAKFHRGKAMLTFNRTAHPDGEARVCGW